MRVACGGLDFEDAFLDGQQRHVEGASTEIEDEHVLLAVDRLLSKPYAIAAAVGSLMIRKQFKPAMTAASLVAWRCESLKYAGTVTTAFLTSFPR